MSRNVLIIWDSAGGQQITGIAATQSAFSDITWDTNSQVGSYYNHTAAYCLRVAWGRDTATFSIPR